MDITQNQSMSTYTFGPMLSAKTLQLGRQMGVTGPVITLMKNLEPYRGYLLMELRNAGIQVTDPSNMYEIVTKYGQAHPELGTPTQEQMGVASNPRFTPKSFDAGSFIGMLGDLVGAIVDGVNDGATATFLQNFARQFQTYMTADMGSIQTTLNATAAAPGPWGGYGAKGALDMLLRFKKTSWKDLKNTITNYCNSKNPPLPIPPAVVTLWGEQEKLEADLRALIGGPNSGAGNTSNQSNEPLTSTPAYVGGGGRLPVMPSSETLMKYLPWIIAVIVAIVIIAMVMRRGKGKKKIVNVN